MIGEGFREARGKVERLLKDVAEGTITRDDFARAIRNLSFSDAGGTQWAPTMDGWVRHDATNQRWEPAQPPLPPGEAARHTGATDSGAPASGIPTPPRDEHRGETVARPAAASALAAGIWPSPPPRSADEVRAEAMACLAEIRSGVRAGRLRLRPRAAQKLAALDDGAADPEALGGAFFLVALDRWESYCRDGDEAALALVHRLAVARCAAEGGARVAGREKARANALHLWMLAHLPTMIRTCDLAAILDDAASLGTAFGCPVDRQRLAARVVEAHAGVARALERAGDGEGRALLLEENGRALARIHEEYARHRTAAGQRPDADEREAWAYLRADWTPSPGRVQLTPEAGGERRRDERQRPMAIRDDPHFHEMLRRGDPDNVVEFVRGRLEEMRNLLQRRLDVRLSAEDVIAPVGEVYRRASGRRERGVRPGGAERHPAFARALQALADGNYERAASAFGQLADQLPDADRNSRDICRHYQAFALAKGGELLQARKYLRDLVDRDFPYAAAYWNLACCYPLEHPEQQVAALALGLERQPHPRLLHGAVALGLRLGREDTQFVGWLEMLTLTESLLLAYYYRYDDLKRRPEAWESALDRLSEYAKAEPSALPDPLGRVEVQRVRPLLDDLVGRRQHAAAAEFWLRARQPVGERRFDYWQLWAQLYDRTGREVEAAHAFKEELRLRLAALRRGDTAGGSPGTNRPEVVRRAAEEWLRRCANKEELRDIGRAIYQMLAQASGSPGLNHLAPQDRRTIERYGERPSPSMSTSPRPTPSASPTGAPAPDPLLAGIAAVCERELGEIANLPRVAAELTRLEAHLVESGYPAVADALHRLRRAWERCGTGERDLEGLKAARAACTDFERQLRRTLPAADVAGVTPLLRAFRRANERLAIALGVLPDLRVEPPTGEAVAVDDTVEGATFAVRVRAAHGAVAVRIIAATATLGGVIACVPLDRFDELAVTIGPPDHSALLTFALPSDHRLGGCRELSVDVDYATLADPDAAHRAADLPVAVAPRPCPPFSDRSRYIFSRALEPDEIDDHFFGRDDEQRRLLDALDNGRLYYIEGMRRVGKSSLLKSLERAIARLALPVTPVYLTVGSVTAADQAGRVLHNLLRAIAAHPNLVAADLAVPSERRCCENLEASYREFVAALPERVLALLDDFQQLIEAAGEARRQGLPLADGVQGLLNLIRAQATPHARLLWAFAGHRTKQQLRLLLPNVLLWATLRPLPIDFLDKDAVRQVVTAPLADTPIILPEETLERLLAHTNGHPELSQHLAEIMLETARRGHRSLLTPADADAAARAVADETDDFRDSWYEDNQLSREARMLMADFVAATRPGQRIGLDRLFPGRPLSDKQRDAVDDLVARKILVHQAGVIGVPAYALDRWLHRVLPTLASEATDGASAIFVDIANLTAGKGEAVLKNLHIDAGDEGIRGQVRLETVLDRIDRYARSLGSGTIALRWAVNYPPNTPALEVCRRKEYSLLSIQDELAQKGSDDRLLANQIYIVREKWPTVTHFVLVLGDKDYLPVVEHLLTEGKHVRVISRHDALAQLYQRLEALYPQRFQAKSLEDLL